MELAYSELAVWTTCYMCAGCRDELIRALTEKKEGAELSLNKATERHAGLLDQLQVRTLSFKGTVGPAFIFVLCSPLSLASIWSLVHFRLL